MLILGFGHRACRGKNAAAQAIADERGGRYNIHQYSFATELKKEANAAAVSAGGMLELFKAGGVTEGFGIGKHFTCFPEWVVYDTEPDMTDPLCPLGKQRKLLQWWGTEYRRAQHPAYWVKKLFKTIDAEKPQVALVTDVRFFNELFALKEKRPDRVGYCIRIDREGFDDSATNSGHVSEQELDAALVGDPRGYDFGITVRDGDLDELLKNAVYLFDLICESLRPPSAEDFTLEAIEAAEQADREQAQSMTDQMEA